MVYASCSSDVIDMSCKKTAIFSGSSLRVSDVYYNFECFDLSRYLRTYDIVHGGLIAAAQMSAVKTDHNQTSVERLGKKKKKNKMKAARLCHPFNKEIVRKVGFYWWEKKLNFFSAKLKCSQKNQRWKQFKLTLDRLRVLYHYFYQLLRD